MSVQHERRVRADNTVQFERLSLQLPRSPWRAHFARGPVIVHERLDDRLAVSCQGRKIARFDRQGERLDDRRRGGTRALTGGR